MLKNNQSVMYFQVQNQENLNNQTAVIVSNPNGTLYKKFFLEFENQNGQISIIDSNLQDEFIILNSIITSDNTKLLYIQFRNIEGKLSRGVENLLSYVKSDVIQESTFVQIERRDHVLYITNTIYQINSISQKRGILILALDLRNSPYYQIKEKKIFYSSDPEQNINTNDALILIDQKYNALIKTTGYYVQLDIEDDWENQHLQIDDYILNEQTVTDFKRNSITFDIQENQYIYKTVLSNLNNNMKITSISHEGYYVCSKTYFRDKSIDQQIQVGKVKNNLIWVKISHESNDYIYFLNVDKCQIYESPVIDLQFLSSVSGLKFQQDDLYFKMIIIQQQNENSYQSYLLEIDLSEFEEELSGSVGQKYQNSVDIDEDGEQQQQLNENDEEQQQDEEQEGEQQYGEEENKQITESESENEIEGESEYSDQIEEEINNDNKIEGEEDEEGYHRNFITYVTIIITIALIYVQSMYYKV